jgi:hypothetical protein
VGWKEELEIAEGVSPGDAAVCAEHCDDDSLKEWIAARASEQHCDYCPREASDPIAVPLDELADHVFHSLQLEYDGADDAGVYFESKEGGYQGPVSPTYDVLLDEGVANHGGLLAHLAQAWDGQDWIRRDVWALSDHEALGTGWERFRQIVTNERRYWFTLAGPDPDEPTAVPPDRLLPAVGAAIEQAGIVRRLDAGSHLFRAHTHTPAERLTGAERLGAPPASHAAANRMSPAGIPLFYAAEDQETAIIEVRAAETDPDRTEVTVGLFETTCDLAIVDLCDLPQIPGLFDEARATSRGALTFLRSFVAQLAEPVVRDGSEHVEYVPTQVFSEWLRWEFRPDGDMIAGVRYSSSRTAGECVALFVSSAADHQQADRRQCDCLHLVDELRPT